MLKVIKRPKEYIAIKVPEDCENVGKFVSNEFKRNSIPLEVTVHYDDNVVTTFGERENERFVKQGDMLVADYSEPCGYVVYPMSQEEFNKQFMPASQTAEASPTLTAYGLCDSKLPDIEGVELPDHTGFSDSFIVELDKALTDYQQKQGQSSQHTSTPHVRIEFDNINDVPHVWIDGKRIDRSDTGLVSVSLDWRTKDPAATDHVIRAYKIEYLKGDHREGIAQRSPIGPDFFKNDAHAK
ncbi:hypothetical protein LTZ20_04025 [Lacticaseibacillus rhamnosus]|uniref:hypothetical protein n=1 Tax=Lacticaseibacillus rhamnosus TaxID=47715 RepID=UPI00237F86C7|nr:hypothetical protein [Lacticaseibacillus rhamnosus]MDE3293207.1 hypothetical protein [Lacticaseibacillus rhamnosus]